MFHLAWTKTKSGGVHHMSWTPLAERFSTLPLILAGPMLRRAEPRAVTVWLALKASWRAILRIYAGNDGGKFVKRFEGTSKTVRLGDHLHVLGVRDSTTKEKAKLVVTVLDD